MVVISPKTVFLLRYGFHIILNGLLDLAIHSNSCSL